jgi:hypothetical protein
LKGKLVKGERWNGEGGVGRKEVRKLIAIILATVGHAFTSRHTFVILLMLHIATSDHHRNDRKLRPNMTAYLKCTAASPTTQFVAEELMFALKPPVPAADPFEDPVSNATAEELLDNHFETNTDAGILCGGQIAL